MGLEPTTFELEVQRANQLRHGGCLSTTFSPTFILFYSVFLIFCGIYLCTVAVFLKKTYVFFQKDLQLFLLVLNFCGIHLSTVALFFCKNLCIFPKKISSSCCLLICSVNVVICIFTANIEIFQTLPH